MSGSDGKEGFISERKKLEDLPRATMYEVEDVPDDQLSQVLTYLNGLPEVEHTEELPSRWLVA